MRTFLICFSLVAVVCAADDQVDRRIAYDHAFPSEEAAAYYAGEITLVEHVNRKGILRLNRDGAINKYLWDLPHEFQMLPYGAIYYQGAAAELKHIPIGTHLHGRFYLGPEGDFDVDNPVSNYAAGKMTKPDMRSSVSQYSRVLLLEDDFSFYQRQNAAWKILSIADDRNQIEVERVDLNDGTPDVPEGEFAGVTGKRILRVDSGTRIWLGRTIATPHDLEAGQIVQVNLGWVDLLGSYKQDGLCRDIWIDQESRDVATEQQRGIYTAHMKRRGVPAKVIRTESVPGEGAKGYVTVQFHAGIEPKMLEEIQSLKSVFIKVAEPTLRTYDGNGVANGSDLEFTQLENPPAGSSGVQMRMRMFEMLEGVRPGRTIRIGDRDWSIPDSPREEKLWTHDIRIFSVGPKAVAHRDGPPSGQSQFILSPDDRDATDETSFVTPAGRTEINSELRTTPLIIDQGGTADKPAIFDGKGMVIDLGIDISDHDWKKEGDLWTSQGKLLGQEPVIAGQVAGLFVGMVPITIPRDVEAEKMHPDLKSRCYFPPEALQPGQMGYAKDGSAYFRWPAGIEPGSEAIIHPAKGAASCVTVACNHVIVRNLIVKYAGNDGFNIHNRWTGVRLENVKSFSNADEGISAHDDVQMEVDGAEIAWNGSASAGIADVNRCTTSYRNCIVHDNAGSAFYLAGKSHSVTDTVIYNQKNDFSVQKGTEFVKERIDFRK